MRTEMKLRRNYMTGGEEKGKKWDRQRSREAFVCWTEAE
jgi:hypothetical protein